MTTPALPTPGAWVIDPAHTVVGFTVRHLMAAKVRGSFKAFEGTIDIAEPLEDSSVTVSIDAASIDTGAADRDGHLRSPDFLDVETHGSLTFESTAVRASGSGYEVDGNLAIRGQEHPVTLTVEYLGVMVDPWGNNKAIFTAETTIDREIWGLTWNAPLETGGVLVGKKVKIELEIQAAPAS